MFALVLLYVTDGGCEDIVVDIYDTEQQCLYSMDDQRIRHGGCFPVEDFIDGFWRPAQQYSDFNPVADTAIVSALTSIARQIPRPYQYSGVGEIHAPTQRRMAKPKMIGTANPAALIYESFAAPENLM